MENDLTSMVALVLLALGTIGWLLNKAQARSEQAACDRQAEYEESVFQAACEARLEEVTLLARLHQVVG